LPQQQSTAQQHNQYSEVFSHVHRKVEEFLSKFHQTPQVDPLPNPQTQESTLPTVRAPVVTSVAPSAASNEVYEWLLHLGLPEYHSSFLAAGFDDMEYVLI
jgi:hypothetical protein